MQISEERVFQGRGCQSLEQGSDGGGRKEACGGGERGPVSGPMRARLDSM